MERGGVEINLLTLFTFPVCARSQAHARRMTVQNTQADSVSKSLYTHTLLHTGETEFSGYLLVLAPRRPLLERRDVPERQSAGEVDDGQQGAVGAQTHAENSILEAAR